MIFAAAVKFRLVKTGEEFVVQCRRHHESYVLLKTLGFKPKEDYIRITEGFVTHKGEFLNRKEAYFHAVECGQISAISLDCIGSTYQIMSEDLW